MGGTTDYGYDFKLTSRWETHVTTYEGSDTQVPGAPFFLRN